MTTERAFDAGQRFLLTSKVYWTTTLYPRLRDKYLEAAGGKEKQHTVEQVAAIVENMTLYRYFAWLERHLQRMKYSGRYGIANYYEEHRDQLLSDLGSPSGNDERLDLRPDLEMPQYYKSVDIHQHPGGVWSRDEAGLVYEYGARSTTPMLGTGHADLHTRFSDLVASQIDAKPARILDLGCGFGKSTLPFVTKFSDAKVEAVDLAGPCLRVGAQTAQSAKVDNVTFRQRNASETGFEDNQFGLVTSTMFLHELPTKVLKDVLQEAYRVLEPGGTMAHLDFYAFPDAFARFMHYGHGRRNNEPFMQPLAELDLPKVLKEAGFTAIQISPFQESETIGPERVDVWRLPWTVISAKKPKQPIQPKRARARELNHA
ncbi:MAG: class I SAM-dependent methyltransferase [Steroidobacteraceae bacterium]